MKYQGEINRLTDEREISKANAFCVGKYIICDGYYMKVDHYEKGKYNLSIHGSAFKPIQNGIVWTSVIRLAWVYFTRNKMKEITEEIYHKKYAETIENLKSNIL